METKHYSKFSYFRENRKLDNGLVNRLIESIKKIGYIKSRPVLIDKYFRIIDGQHRFEACKALGIPIIYDEIDTNNPMSVVLELNRNQLIWRLEDFINSYANQGKPEYIYLREIETKYRLFWSNTIRIVGNDRLFARNIRKGDAFTINPNTEDIISFILSLKELDYYLSIHFVGAVVVLWRVTTPIQRAKIYKNRMLIPHAPSRVAYLTIFENIINKHSHDKISLFVK